MNNNELNNKNNISSVNVKNYYPASITILLNTRILGHTKEIYTPSMTLPSFSSSSKTVYFNPLIKLDQKIVQTIPKGKTNDFIYEQFFTSSYFNSLLIRSQYYPQPKRTLEQATEEGIVDNNIKILLDTLFDTNKPFYIDKKRYTSHGYKWNKGDWIIESNNSSKIIKKFYNYYQQSNINSYPRNAYASQYSMPTASVQTIIPSAPMIVPTATTLYQPNQLMYPNVGQSNILTYQTPILQSYPYQSVVIPNAVENPMFESFNKFEENVDENILHGSSASSTFGDIIDEQRQNKQKTRKTADKEIASQGQIQQQSRQSKNVIQQQQQQQQQQQGQQPSRQSKQPSYIANYTVNQNEYQPLIDQFLFYALDGFKNGFISGNRIKCSQITSVSDLTKIQNGSFYNNKIQPWTVLSNDGNGDCLFYVFCQLLNSSDYKVNNSTLKNRKNTFNTPNNIKNISYYDNDGNYTVAGLRNIVADFILYTEKGKNIGNMLISRNTNSPEDQYIVSGDLNKTLNNMRTCADEKNRSLSKQKTLSDDNYYYWGDETAINIVEYIFQVKSILIHKPKFANNKIEMYNTSDKITKNLKTTNNGDYIEIDYMENNSSIKVEGYLIEKKFTVNQELQSITILKTSGNDTECKYEKKQIDNNNNDIINRIHKIEKYKIYNNAGFNMNNSQPFKNYVYILNHDETHYEAVNFNIRGNMRCVFNDMDIFNFHPYIIYMIFIYAYMVATPASSSFYNTTLQRYLDPLYNYYSYNNVIKNNRLLLGGASSGDDGEVNGVPNTNNNSYYGQFKNYVNDKLNQQLSIDDSGKNIPVYYANPNLSYYVVVDLELFPGDKISDIDKRNLTCQIKFDNIRKSYADLLGYQYQPSLLNTNVMPSSSSGRSSGSSSGSSGSSSSGNTKSTSNSNNNSTKKNSNGNNNNRNNNTNNYAKNNNQNTRKYRG
jgi:hypothetical protein